MRMTATCITLALAVVLTPGAFAQSTSTATGGAGGAGGSATGGNATGGTATGGTATNSNNTSGVSNASGGTGGTSSASGGSVGTVSTGASSAQTGASSATLGDVTVNYNLPASPTGRAGLGVGVDAETGHVVTDTNVKYGGTYTLKNTPEVVVGGPASGPCNGFSGGIGISMAGIGIGANTSTVDPGCTARETARVAAMIGRMDIANAVLENLPAVQAALREKAERDRMFSTPAEGTFMTPPARSSIDTLPADAPHAADATPMPAVPVAPVAFVAPAAPAASAASAAPAAPAAPAAYDAPRLVAPDPAATIAAKAAADTSAEQMPDPSRMTRYERYERAKAAREEATRGMPTVADRLNALAAGFGTRSHAVADADAPVAPAVSVRRASPSFGSETAREVSARTKNVDSNTLPAPTGSGVQPGNMGPGNVRS